jgi:hypothetical protein
MNDVLSLVYLANAVLLIALVDHMRTVRPLAQAFVLLGSAAIIGHIVGPDDTVLHSQTRAILFATTPAACTWAVLTTCSTTVRKRWFVVGAVATLVLANLMPRNELVIEFCGHAVRQWQRDYGLFWCGIWVAWAVVSIVGWWRLYRAPGGFAHILAGLMAASVLPEAVGFVAWGANAEWYSITCATDLLFGGAVSIVASYALWRTRHL